MSAPEKTSQSPKRKEGAKRAVRFVVRGHARAVAAIAATAFLGGVAEALFLITITRTGFAIKDGNDRIGVVSDWSLSLGSTLLIAVALIAFRVVLAALASWQSANVATRVVAQIRERLSQAFLDSSWETQQAQKSGSLQELLTTYSHQADLLVTNLTIAAVMLGNLVALLSMAIAVDPVGAFVLVVSVTALGLLLRPLRAAVRRRARKQTSAGMDFAVSVNEVSELGFELHVFHVQGKAQARVRQAIEQARKATASTQLAAGLSTPIYLGLAYLAVVGA
ncbi:MAG TPA: ABC transporter transmembrane domain-containing protein, partial [Acidimicrobiia bacterium]|nr:ABC transporter transmembrane domain-containing protein [Acidimicrobiia bacterium]